jgi:hypothetical protein
LSIGDRRAHTAHTHAPSQASPTQTHFLLSTARSGTTKRGTTPTAYRTRALRLCFLSGAGYAPPRARCIKKRAFWNHLSSSTASPPNCVVSPQYTALGALVAIAAAKSELTHRRNLIRRKPLVAVATGNPMLRPATPCCTVQFTERSSKGRGYSDYRVPAQALRSPRESTGSVLRTWQDPQNPPQAHKGMSSQREKRPSQGRTPKPCLQRAAGVQPHITCSLHKAHPLRLPLALTPFSPARIEEKEA